MPPSRKGKNQKAENVSESLEKDVETGIKRMPTKLKASRRSKAGTDTESDSTSDEPLGTPSRKRKGRLSSDGDSAPSPQAESTRTSAKRVKREAQKEAQMETTESEDLLLEETNTEMAAFEDLQEEINTETTESDYLLLEETNMEAENPQEERETAAFQSEDEEDEEEREMSEDEEETAPPVNGQQSQPGDDASDLVTVMMTELKALRAEVNAMKTTDGTSPSPQSVATKTGKAAVSSGSSKSGETSSSSSAGKKKNGKTSAGKKKNGKTCVLPAEGETSREEATSSNADLERLKSKVLAKIEAMHSKSEAPPSGSGAEVSDLNSTAATTTSSSDEVKDVSSERVSPIIPLPSPIVPVDNHLSEEMKTDIANKVAVNFNLLINKEMKVEKDLEKLRTTKQRSTVKKTAAALQQEGWISAWNIFLAVYLSQHPDAVAGMAYHFQQVHKLMLKSDPRADWCGYDVTYRVMVEKDVLKWGEASHEMYADALLHFAEPPSTSVKKSEKKLEKKPEKKAPTSAQKINTVKTERVEKDFDYVPSGYCIRFHKEGNCRGNPCRYNHTCFKCMKGAHSATHCVLQGSPGSYNNSQSRFGGNNQFQSSFNNQSRFSNNNQSNYSNNQSRFGVGTSQQFGGQKPLLSQFPNRPAQAPAPPNTNLPPPSFYQSPNRSQAPPPGIPPFNMRVPPPSPAQLSNRPPPTPTQLLASIPPPNSSSMPPPPLSRMLPPSGTSQRSNVPPPNQCPQQ